MNVWLSRTEHFNDLSINLGIHFPTNTVDCALGTLIDQVVKQHLSQYRYCYQRELQKDHTLGGKVTLKWIIASDGTVSSASVKRTTVGNSAVTSCMLNVARRMQFPSPKGGIVIVSYPFLFSPA